MSKHGSSVLKMLAAYKQAALFSSVDKNGVPLDRKYSEANIIASTNIKMIADVVKFYTDNVDDIGTRFEEAGADFWLTRNREGSGFWDGDWPEPQAARLTKAAHAFGEMSLDVSRGKIYGSSG